MSLRVYRDRFKGSLKFPLALKTPRRVASRVLRGFWGSGSAVAGFTTLGSKVQVFRGFPLWAFCFSEAEASTEVSSGAQRLQYPLIKEYSLDHIKDPTII